MPRQTTLELAEPDYLALRRAIMRVERHRERRLEMEALRKERGWLAAAIGAAFDCQSRSLDLPPWGRPPCVAKLRGNQRDPAVYLLKRMLRRGVSRFEPDPLGAIARAGRRLNSERDL